MTREFTNKSRERLAMKWVKNQSTMKTLASHKYFIERVQETTTEARRETEKTSDLESGDSRTRSASTYENLHQQVTHEKSRILVEDEKLERGIAS
jgi:hypothetical protein